VYDATLYRLKVFTLVVERRSAGAAAAVLGLSQPSVSTHIKGLEALLGQPLFDRRPGRPMELTDAGRLVYAYAHETVLGAENVIDVLKDLTEGRRGHAMIAVSRGLVHDAITPLLLEHRRRSPEVLVSVLSGTLAEVIEFVETGEVSFGLVTTVGPTGGLRSRLLCPVRLDVIAAPGHHLARRPVVTPEDLAREPCIMPRRTSSHFRLISGLARQAGYVFGDVAFEVDDGMAMSSLVREGTAVAVALRTGIERELALGNLVTLNLRPVLPPVELRLISRPSRRFAPAEQRLMRLALDLFHRPGPDS
jgi:LysR family transcriptional regulator, low CO2-responsive transcriptional regulator